MTTYNVTYKKYDRYEVEQVTAYQVHVEGHFILFYGEDRLLVASYSAESFVKVEKVTY